jgi:polyisoprenoid-binding protein YceI
MNKVLLTLLLWSGLNAWAAAYPSKLEGGDHCVAYRVEKTMFFVKGVEVVGRNCDISAQILPEVGGLYRIEVNIPIDKFSSGEAERDKDVRKILKADVKPEMTFRSKALTTAQWNELLVTKDFVLEGELSIGEKFYPLKVIANHEMGEPTGNIDGVAKATFSDFELKPPKVGGGVIAKTKKNIELDFHLQVGRILGADFLKSEKQ